MSYIKVVFEVPDESINDMLIARLSDEGYEGFEETDGKLLAYVPEPAFSAEVLYPVTEAFGLDYQTEIVPDQNWNAVWESNFEPAIIDGLCTIRADFHHLTIDTPYEIIITPKMAFGTGHHATTHLMIAAMGSATLKGKRVLDFGTGTGVLSIFAEKLGAASVTAIDNDEWAVDNAKDNIVANNCNHITVSLGSISDTKGVFDLILANINRHILLEYMRHLFDKLATKGFILMSGLLEDDEAIIRSAATATGLEYVDTSRRNGWIALRFSKD